jgi:hypothetical protein
MKIIFYWDKIPRSLAVWQCSFRVVSCLHLQDRRVRWVGKK